MKPEQKCPRGVLAIVGLVAALVGGLALLATQLWLSTEARGYVVLAGGIAERFDWTQELFLMRPPGYPLMLAAIFRIFGEDSPAAIHAVQHGMVAAISLVTTLIAWHLTTNRAVAIISGLLSACNLQLLGFANMVMSEVPFTLLFLGSIYFIVKFGRYGLSRPLVLGSLLGGLSYLFRPMGLTLVAVCAAAALHQCRRQRHKDGLPVRALGHLGGAIVPALLVAGPWMLFLAKRGDGLGASFGPTLFGRLVTLDRLDSQASAAWLEMKNVVDDAKRTGRAPPEADPRQEGTVRDAYGAMRQASYAQACAKMERVGLDLLWEHPGSVGANTLRYAAWTLLVPDSSYRYLPAGTPGIEIREGHCIRNAEADVFDCATYEPMMRPLIGPYQKYLPLRSEPRTLTPPWTAIVRAFHRCTDSGVAGRASMFSPYGIYMVLSVLGIVVALFSKQRATWCLLVAAIGLQIIGSAALVGPVPRYAIPVQPLLGIFVAVSLVVVAAALGATGSLPARADAGGEAASAARRPKPATQGHILRASEETGRARRRRRRTAVHSW